MVDFYVIYRQGDAKSEEYLKECQTSASYYGVNTIPYPGCYTRIPELLEQEDLFLQTNRKTVINTTPKQGCFLSHYFLWKKCVELQEPIGVFEYDAILIKPIPEDILDTFTDWLNLDINRFIYDRKVAGYFDSVLAPAEFEVKNFRWPGTCRNPDFINSLKFIFRSSMRGSHAYIIKPEAAQKLIDAAKLDGILPADLMPSLRYIDLKYTVPSLACINPRMWYTRQQQSHTLNDQNL